MLMHHPQTEPDRVVRRPDLALHAVNPDLPFIGGLEAVKELHDGRFARAVFADDGVYGAGGDREVDVSVRGHRAEAFGDSAHFYYVLIHFDASHRAHRAHRAHGEPWRVFPLPFPTIHLSIFPSVASVSSVANPILPLRPSLLFCPR